MPNEYLCRWARWGREADALPLDDRPELKAYLAQQLGALADPPVQPAPIDSIHPTPSRLTDDERAAFIEKLGQEQVRFDDTDRLMHSVGRSYRDAVRAWVGRIDPVTDAVLYPKNEADVAAALEIARQSGIAVVPFGGGTSVVGGVEPRTGPHHAVITLDTMHLNRITMDHTSLLAEIGAGAFGPEIEHTLNEAGFTLGHFPQSFEFSALGGWIASRGAGQQSTQYGKIEEIIQAIRIATPAGRIETRNVPAAASGPSVLQSVIGSEGTAGVITSATARIQPLPEKTQYAAFLVPTFDAGCQLLRRLAQCEPTPSVVRLADAEETRWLSKASAGQLSLTLRIGKALIRRSMRRRGFDESQTCMALLSFAGNRSVVKLGVRQARAIAADLDAISIGASPGRRWERDRFRLPYLRDELLSRRVMIDTLETATTWTNLPTLYDAVRHAIDEAMRRAGHPGAITCHLSHIYPTGSSLYFTFLARQVPGREIEQWQQIKNAATAAILAHHGTLSHHHGIGYEHQPLSAEHGSVAVAAMAGAKTALDPTGIMNPGKLLAD